MKAPAYQFYVGDCDTDEAVRAMDDREFGFFIRCLNHAWVNRGLPKDLDELARVMGRSKAYVERVWQRVGRCFQEQDDRLLNPRQEREREALEQWRQRCSEFGRRSGVARRRVPSTEAEPTLNLPSTEVEPSLKPRMLNTRVLKPRMLNSSSSIEEREILEGDIPPKKNELSDSVGDFLETGEAQENWRDRFWRDFRQLYPKRGRLNPDIDFQLLLSVVDSEPEAEKVITELKRWVACEDWRKGFVEKASRWISERMWNVEPPPPKPKQGGRSAMEGVV